MDEDVIADLKQFIATTVNQHFGNFATKDDLHDLATKEDINRLEAKTDRIEAKTDRLEAKIDSIQDAINESIVPYTSQLDDQVQDHEKRLTKLEHHPHAA